MSNILKASDANAITRDSRKSNQFIEQFNKQVMEAAKEGFYCTNIYIRFSDDIEDMDYLYKDLDDNDPNVQAAREAGYLIHVNHENNGFHHLYVCWNTKAVWDDEIKDFVIKEG